MEEDSPRDSLNRILAQDSTGLGLETYHFLISNYQATGNLKYKPISNLMFSTNEAIKYIFTLSNC